MVDLTTLLTALAEIRAKAISEPPKSEFGLQIQLSINTTNSFPLISGQASFQETRNDDRYSLGERTILHQYLVEDLIKETLDYYFPGVEFMKRVEPASLGRPFSFAYHPLLLSSSFTEGSTSEGEIIRQQVLANQSGLILSSLPKEMSDMVLERLNMDKLEFMYFNASVPFPNSMKNLVLKYYPSLAVNVTKAKEMFPGWRFNWLEVLNRLERPRDKIMYEIRYLKMHRSPNKQYFKTGNMCSPSLRQRSGALSELFTSATLPQSQRKTQLVGQFLQAIRDNNLSTAILIAADSDIIAMSQNRETVMMNGVPYTWGKILVDLVRRLQVGMNIPSAPETYKFLFKLLVIDSANHTEGIFGQTNIPNVTAVEEDAAYDSLESRSKKLADITGMERVKQGLEEVIKIKSAINWRNPVVINLAATRQ
jgi:hypothetical protein